MIDSLEFAQAYVGVPADLSAFPMALAKALPFWPGAACALLAVWLMRLRLARGNRLVVDHAEAAAALERFVSEPAAEPPPVPLPDIIASAARVPAQGDDLAARARFVAMNFAFPDAGLHRSAATDWPLLVTCQPLRFTLTLRHAALRYRLAVSNRGAEVLGPLMIRADLVAGESAIVCRGQSGFAEDALPLCHYLDGLLPGDSIELSGELQMPLAGIAAMRLGSAKLLVPLVRLCAESAGDALPDVTVSACFAIGLPPLSAGGGLQPFRLDSGTGIWRKLTARRLLLADLH